MSSPSDPLRPYTPRVLRQWLAEAPDARSRVIHGTVVMVDITGFTALSERLARAGRVGAEELSETIGTCFAALLAVAYDAGGSMLKFGGDAMVILFRGDDDLGRACRAAAGMRTALTDVGEVVTSRGRVRLRMSAGIHRATFELFLVGGSHRELLLTGPAATEVVRAEEAARSGEIVLSASTAAEMPRGTLGAPRGSGQLLRRAPEGANAPVVPGRHWSDVDVLATIPRVLREHVLAERHEPEHRRVTVAFVRYTGLDRHLTERGTEVTARDLDVLVHTVQQAIDARQVGFLGSDIASDGGKLLLSAGAPSSAGNDEERMLLALREIVGSDHPFPVHIGVTVGHVFAGDIGPSQRRTYTVMGDAVNLAARIVDRAPPRAVLATQEVMRASRTTFDTDTVPPFAVRGRRGLVAAATVGPSSGVRDADADEPPLVGRDGEIGAIDRVLRAARDGTGALVEITGEAGIGKTRLLRACGERAGPLPVHRVEGELHRMTVPYATLRRLLRGTLDIPLDADGTTAARRLEAALRHAPGGLRDRAPLLALAFGTRLPATPATADLDGRFVRPRLHAAIRDLLTWHWDGPVVVLFDDAQWIDEASAAAVRDLAGDLREHPWVLCLARPEPDVGLPEHAPRVPVPVGPLDEEAGQRLLHNITEHDPLAPHTASALLTRAGGNPLFLRELVAAAGDVADVDALPDSVGSLVTASIDRLPTAQRRTLREVSVLGSSFPRDLATAVLSDPAADLEALADFLVVEDDRLSFRHAVLRDVAHAGLPYRARRHLHGLAGDAIARRDPDRVEVLSSHYHEAGRYEDAWLTSRRAGDTAAASYANSDAAAFYVRALLAARHLQEPDPTELARVHEALGDARQRLGDPAGAAAAYRDACDAVRDDVVRWAQLRLKLAQAVARLDRYSQALGLLTRTMRRLEERSDRPARRERAQLTVWYGHLRLQQGRYAEAIRWSERAVVDATAAGDREALGHAYRLLDWAHVERGRPEQAVYSARALDIYEKLGDLPNLTNVRNNLGGIAYWLGDWEQALVHYRAAIDLDERTGDVVGAALGRSNVAEILSDQGHWRQAVGLFREGERVLRAARFLSALAYVRANLGRALTRLGEHDAAERVLLTARDDARSVGADSQVADVEARLAELEVLRARPHEASLRITAARAAHRSGSAAGLHEPAIERTRGYAALQLARWEEAEEALHRSLTAAEARGAEYEAALTRHALVELAEARGEEPDRVLVTASRRVLGRLRVERLPQIPRSTQPTVTITLPEPTGAASSPGDARG